MKVLVSPFSLLLSPAALCTSVSGGVRGQGPRASWKKHWWRGRALLAPCFQGRAKCMIQSTLDSLTLFSISFFFIILFYVANLLISCWKERNLGREECNSGIVRATACRRTIPEAFRVNPCHLNARLPKQHGSVFCPYFLISDKIRQSALATRYFI